jgi:hypothetical protein
MTVLNNDLDKTEKDHSEILMFILRSRKNCHYGHAIKDSNAIENFILYQYSIYAAAKEREKYFRKLNKVNVTIFENNNIVLHYV